MSTPTQIQERRSTLAWVLLVLLALIWGSSFILIKKGLTAFTPTQVGALRIFSAFFVFLPVAVSSRKKSDSVSWWHVFLSGLLGSLIPAFLFSTAGAHLNSSVSGTLNALTPLCTLVIGTLFFGNPLVGRQAIGLALGLLGCALLMLVNASGEVNFTDPYALLVLLATVSYGANVNLVKRFLGGIPPLALSAFALVGIGPIAGIVLFSTDFVDRFQAENLFALTCVIALGVMGTALANALFYRIIQLSTPVFASSVTYLIPLVAVGWGILDGEQLFFWQYAGMLSILLGVYLVTRKA